MREGDHYIVTGQKMWTSYAHVATQMFCLVRTTEESRKQVGLSLLLIDMKTPGITVRPIETMDEMRHSNEVFLDDVRVPLGGLLGAEGMGWTYGKALLDRERAFRRHERTFGLCSTCAMCVKMQKRRSAGGLRIIDRPYFRTKLAQLDIETIAIETMVMRLMADAASGVDSGPRASMLKLRWSELVQRTTELWFEALGADAARFFPVAAEGDSLWADDHFVIQAALDARVTSIYGGSSEIQRNIIARRALGL